MSKNEKVFVFDLNGTLLARIKERKGKYLSARDADGIIPGTGDLIYIRPHLDKLISYLDDNEITYVLWTTAMEHNGIHLVSALREKGLKNHKHSLYHSHSTPIKEHPYKRAKNMQVVADIYNTSIDNVFLIDDEQIKCIPDSCYISIDPYDPLNKEDDALIRIVDTIKSIIDK